MDFSNTDLNLTSFDKKMVSNYLLLFPEIDENGFDINKENSSYYYVIDSDWKELNDEMEFVKPLIPRCNY